MAAPTDSLFRTFPFGTTTLPNRIVMAPMTRSMSPGGVPTPEVAAYYRRRAEGGTGLIVTEGTEVDHWASNGYPAVPRFFGDDPLAGWTKKLTGKHAITVGSVGLDTGFLGAFTGKPATPTGIDKLLRRLEAGEFDLVAVGRALLADPQWPVKIREGRLDDIVPFTAEHLAQLT